jgi:hypothetical protein
MPDFTDGPADEPKLPLVASIIKQPDRRADEIFGVPTIVLGRIRRQFGDK